LADTFCARAFSYWRGVILSTHDPDQAFALNARVLLMHNGSVLADGPAAEVLSGENLSTIYGLNITVETTASGRRVCLPSLRQSAPGLPAPDR